jgi:hypothetical protein
MLTTKSRESTFRTSNETAWLLPGHLFDVVGQLSESLQHRWFGMRRAGSLAADPRNEAESCRRANLPDNR